MVYLVYLIISPLCFLILAIITIVMWALFVFDDEYKTERKGVLFWGLNIVLLADLLWIGYSFFNGGTGDEYYEKLLMVAFFSNPIMIVSIAIINAMTEKRSNNIENIICGIDKEEENYKLKIIIDTTEYEEKMDFLTAVVEHKLEKENDIEVEIEKNKIFIKLKKDSQDLKKDLKLLLEKLNNVKEVSEEEFEKEKHYLQEKITTSKDIETYIEKMIIESEIDNIRTAKQATELMKIAFKNEKVKIYCWNKQGEHEFYKVATEIIQKYAKNKWHYEAFQIKEHVEEKYVIPKEIRLEKDEDEKYIVVLKRKFDENDAMIMPAFLILLKNKMGKDMSMGYIKKSNLSYGVIKTKQVEKKDIEEIASGLKEQKIDMKEMADVIRGRHYENILKERNMEIEKRRISENGLLKDENEIEVYQAREGLEKMLKYFDQYIEIVEFN